MQKIDFKKELKQFYRPSANQFSVVDVPAFNFLMIDGMGDPGSGESYAQALEALYTVSYNIRFSIKKQMEIAYTVMPLQGLWWAQDMDVFVTGDRSAWEWTMMIMQPDFISAEMVSSAIDEVKRKKDPIALPLLRFESFTEGSAAQIMYFGPYADEGPTIAKLHDFIAENGHQLSGKHHEIYLSDPRRTEPSKLKTIIRQPFQ
jgi:hypothetical protein